MHNQATWPVLLLEGETLLGAWQNRTLNVSVLVGSRATLTVPVSCVEAGRWHDGGEMGRSGRHTPTDLRRVKSTSVNAARVRGERAESDQHAVWERIADYQQHLAAPTSTGALDDVYGHVGDDVDAMVRDLAPHPDQCGVVVAVGGELRGLDAFDKPSTLASYWDSLVTGYAIDALRESDTAAPTTADAERFLARVGTATDTRIPAVGLGVGHALSGDGIDGQALECGRRDRPPGCVRDLTHRVDRHGDR